MDWKRIGMNLATMLVGALPILIPAWIDIKGRIDSGKDEQRAHWQAERHHKDSCDFAHDAQDSIDRQFIIRQNDTIIYLLRR